MPAHSKMSVGGQGPLSRRKRSIIALASVAGFVTGPTPAPGFSIGVGVQHPTSTLQLGQATFTNATSVFAGSYAAPIAAVGGVAAGLMGLSHRRPCKSRRQVWPWAKSSPEGSQVSQSQQSLWRDEPTTTQLAPLMGRRKSLLIGIDYNGQPGQLRGCQSDVRRMRPALEKLGFPSTPDCQMVLMDDSYHTAPTRANIVRACQWLLSDVAMGDSLFFHYSGHGGRVVAEPEEQTDDGYHETLVPLDFDLEGQIKDKELFELLVRPLPAGAKLTCVIDACFSAGAANLPYLFAGTSDNLQRAMAGQVMQMAMSRNWESDYKQWSKSGDATDLLLNAGSMGLDLWKLYREQQRCGESGFAVAEGQNAGAAVGEVIAFTGCRSNQTSADVANINLKFSLQSNGQQSLIVPPQKARAGGALTTVFLESMELGEPLSYLGLLERMQQRLEREGFSQVPQLASSLVLDLQCPFTMDSLTLPSVTSNECAGRTVVDDFLSAFTSPEGRRMLKCAQSVRRITLREDSRKSRRSNNDEVLVAVSVDSQPVRASDIQDDLSSRPWDDGIEQVDVELVANDLQDVSGLELPSSGSNDSEERGGVLGTMSRMFNSLRGEPDAEAGTDAQDGDYDSEQTESNVEDNFQLGWVFTSENDSEQPSTDLAGDFDIEGPFNESETEQIGGFDAMMQAISEVQDGLSSFSDDAQNAFGSVGDGLSSFSNEVKDGLSSVGDGLSSLVDNAQDGLSSLGDSFPQLESSQYDNEQPSNDLTSDFDIEMPFNESETEQTGGFDAMMQAFSEVQDGLSSFSDDVQDGFGSLGDNVQDGLSSIGDGLSSVGDGLSSMGDSLGSIDFGDGGSD